MQRVLFSLLASAVGLAMLLAGPTTAHARQPRGDRGLSRAGNYPNGSVVVYYDASPGTIRVSYREIQVFPVSASSARVSFYNGGNGAGAAPITVIRVVVPRSDVLPLSEFGNSNFPAMAP
jgi:hypothetical protein